MLVAANTAFLLQGDRAALGRARSAIARRLGLGASAPLA